MRIKPEDIFLTNLTL